MVGVGVGVCVGGVGVVCDTVFPSLFPLCDPPFCDPQVNSPSGRIMTLSFTELAAAPWTLPSYLTSQPLAH